MRRYLSRVVLISLMLTVYAAPARADLLKYTFTGVVGDSYSALNLGNGWVDITNAAFTITGLIGDPCCAIPNSSSVYGAWDTIPTYDFGALGSFTMEPGFNQGVTRFSQMGINGIDVISLSLWYPGTIDFQGVSAIIPHLAGDVSVPQIFDIMNPISSASGRPWLMTNLAGQQLGWGNACANCPRTTLTSVKVESVPEPSTLILISIGIGVAIRRRRLHG